MVGGKGSRRADSGKAQPMNLQQAKGLLLSLVDDRTAQYGTAELDMDAAIELCRNAIRYCWLKENYDLAARDVDSIPLSDDFIDSAMRGG